jgi:hypothetical protein
MTTPETQGNIAGPLVRADKSGKDPETAIAGVPKDVEPATIVKEAGTNEGDVVAKEGDVNEGSGAHEDVPMEVDGVNDDEVEKNDDQGKGRAGAKVNKQAEEILQLREDKMATEKAKQQTREVRGALLGYGLLDVLKMDFTLGPNSRPVIETEVRKLMKSFIDHGRMFWLTENVITVLVHKSWVELESLSPDMVELTGQIKLTAAYPAGQMIRLSGGHRIEALKRLDAKLKKDVEAIEDLLDDGEQLADEKIVLLKKEQERLRQDIASVGCWGVQVLDAGESLKNILSIRVDDVKINKIF